MREKVQASDKNSNLPVQTSGSTGLFILFEVKWTTLSLVELHVDDLLHG